jgi:sugar O-acyltransferase (sialic acid O-acetyltransferase NeuD family)
MSKIKIAIIGNGGFSKELKSYINDCYDNLEITNFVDEEYLDSTSKPINELIENIDSYLVYIGIGSGKIRRKFIEEILPENTRYGSMIHPTAYIGNNVSIGEGVVVCPYCVLTSNIEVKSHVQLNIQTSIGHDSIIGKYTTTSPKVSISGNNKIGSNVYLGTGSSTKEDISICDNVIIGLNAGVVKSIHRDGVYVGTPAIEIK